MNSRPSLIALCQTNHPRLKQTATKHILIDIKTGFTNLGKNCSLIRFGIYKIYQSRSGLNLVAVSLAIKFKEHNSDILNIIASNDISCINSTRRVFSSLKRSIHRSFKIEKTLNSRNSSPILLVVLLRRQRSVRLIIISC